MMRSRSSGCTCIAKPCRNWARVGPLCHQHKAIVGWRAAADAQTAFLERKERPIAWLVAKAKAINQIKELNRAYLDTARG